MQLQVFGNLSIVTKFVWDCYTQPLPRLCAPLPCFCASVCARCPGRRKLYGRHQDKYWYDRWETKNLCISRVKFWKLYIPAALSTFPSLYWFHLWCTKRISTPLRINLFCTFKITKILNLILPSIYIYIWQDSAFNLLIIICIYRTWPPHLRFQQYG